MKPQVGDIVQVKEVYRDTRFSPRSGLVIRLVTWPDEYDALVDCVVFHDTNFTNPIQLQTRFVEVISRA